MLLKQRRRKKLLATPFPPEWKQIIEARIPLFNRLSEPDQRELEGHIHVFLAEKRFEGCGGLKLTDEMKVCIAAQACLLLLHRDSDYYPGLRSILVYPSTYFVKSARQAGTGVIEENHEARLGEAWHSGAVVLAWDSVLGGTSNPADGHNVVLHEFAHQLDFEDGRADGAPLLGSDTPFWRRRNRYATWAKVLSAEYEQLRIKAEKEQRSVLDSYGATNPAEFFAVITEAFFEKPAQLRQKHPELYQELKEFYRQDPAQWTPSFPGT